jgi:hypothetical protein
VRPYYLLVQFTLPGILEIMQMLQSATVRPYYLLVWVLWPKQVYFLFQDLKPPLFGGQAKNGDPLYIKGGPARKFL